MIIRYLINPINVDDMVKYTFDFANHRLYLEYRRNGSVSLSKEFALETIDNVDSNALPSLEMAKKGKIWDMHISKRGVDGNIHRKTCSFVCDEDLSPYRVEFENDSPTTLTLKDYYSYELSAYESALEIVSHRFDNSDRLSGKSSSTLLSPLIEDGSLVIADGADVNIDLSAGLIDLNEDRYFTFMIAKAPLSINSADITMKVYFGNNILELTPNGLFLNGTYICSISKVKSNTRIVFSLSSTDDTMLINGTPYSVTVDKTAGLGTVRITGNSSDGSKYNVDEVALHSSESYFADSNPPAIVTHIDAIAGDKEVYLKWQENTESDLAGYNVYVNGLKNNLALIPTSDFQVVGLQNGVESTIVVTAQDTSGNESIASEPIKITTVSDQTLEVSSVSVSSSQNGVRFEFVSPVYTTMDKIRIYRENLSNLGQVFLGEISYNENYFVDTPPPVDGRYRYTITTVDVHGAETTGVTIYHTIVLF